MHRRISTTVSARSYQSMAPSKGERPSQTARLRRDVFIGRGAARGAA
jgi:hypothetical protein